MNNFIIIDLETGGYEEKQNPITEVGLVVLDSKLKELYRAETHVQNNFELKLEKAALEASRVTLKQIEGGITTEELIEILTYIFKEFTIRKRYKPILVNHNVGFDLKFLKYLFFRHDKDIFDFLDLNTYDTLMNSRFAWSESLKSDDNNSFKLIDCCKRAGIKLVDAHGALNDAVAAADLFRYLVNRLKFGGTEIKTQKQDEVKSRSFFEM